MVQNQVKSLEMQLDMIFQIGNKLELKFESNEIKAILVFLNAVESVFLELKGDIKLLDRASLLLKISSAFSEMQEKHEIMDYGIGKLLLNFLQRKDIFYYIGQTD